ncbi:hypothetical protein CTA1_6556 [Colletotrichum tanaceti]|uniref:Uncharacterized protein n=1 Tax=Colletotrichum tanaceti TaxID=1306861 RepID=A0A4U6X5A5_9PEZI|nr:hypothetical protein CTA1_6556 [Colletotrichum tanaceti]
MRLMNIKYMVLFIGLSNLTLGLKILIGYRRVNFIEALKITRRGNIFRNPAFDGDANDIASAQIGNGVYLSMNPTGFDGRQGDWWCYVAAEMRPLAKTPKVWINESLWNKPEIKIAAFVQTKLHKGESASSAIRMSQAMYYSEGTIQMLIPTQMVQNNTLQTAAHCYRYYHDLPVRRAVEYDSWAGFRN